MSELQKIQESEMQSRGLKLGTNNLVDYLVNCGKVCLDKLGDLIVMSFQCFDGRTIRAYGRSFRSALLSLSYQTWCVRGLGVI